MKKVDTKVLNEIMGATPYTPPNMVDCSYKKGHDVPEGIYLVKLVSVKCHGPYSYKMQVEVLNYTNGKDYPDPKVISGYAGRRGKDFSDLEYCFAPGVVHKRSSGYVGCYGVINLTHSGWMELLPQDMFDHLFPPF